MRIKQLRLKNFRGIKNLELNFDVTQQIIILVGVNGVGKSSVLDCIGSLVNSYEGITVEETFRYVFQKRDIYTGEDSTCNGLSIVLDGNEINWMVEKNREEIRSIVRTEKDDILVIKESWGQYDKDSFVSLYYSASRKSIQIQDYNKTQRLTDPDVKEFIRKANSNNLDGLPAIQNIIDFKEFTVWFHSLEDLENETRLSINKDYRDNQLEATREAIYSLLGNGFSDLRMKRAVGKLTIHKNSQEIELDWLSDGEKGLMALAGDLAWHLAITYPHSVNPLHEAGLVLIDEIELHLHPEWQRIIIQRLTQTFPGCQFIVTTHSPQVLSNVQPECIHILAIEDDNVVVKRPERSYGRDSNRILEDIMGVSKRPPEIEARILELFRIIHDGELDRAKELIQDLATEIGIDEPELIRAASTIHRREVIGR
jgi:predicted ATP-binding protein involved in virulence